MFVDVVRDMNVDGRTKILLETMAEEYESGLPKTLSMNHYELSDEYGFTPKQWSDFLKNKEIERLVEMEIVNIAEIGARKALDKLQSGNAASSDVSAAREVLASSKLLKQKNDQKPLVVVTRIPAKEFDQDEQTTG